MTMLALPYKPGKALSFAVLLWLTGFVWGSVVFMSPALHVAPIPYVSSNPAISFPILVMWFILAVATANFYLRDASNKAAEGLKLGLTFTIVNLVLDLIVLVLLLKAGFKYFVSLSVWTAYAMLILVPWYVGKRKEVSSKPR